MSSLRRFARLIADHSISDSWDRWSNNVEQLGVQLYPGATATIADLISSAWDADARAVWIDLPLGTAWTESDQITVTDDGVGMFYGNSQWTSRCWTMCGSSTMVGGHAISMASQCAGGTADG